MQDGILMQLEGIKETEEHDESMFYSATQEASNQNQRTISDSKLIEDP